MSGAPSSPPQGPSQAWLPTGQSASTAPQAQGLAPSSSSALALLAV